MKKLCIVLLLSLSIPILSGCLPLVAVGGVATGAFVGSDPRSSVQIKNDLDLYGQIEQKIGQTYPNKLHVTVTVMGGRVLLTGEVPDSATQQAITQIAQQNPLTRQVFNQTVIAPASSLSSRAHDSAITTKVKTALMSSSFISSLHIKVLTERGVVYLIGTVKRADGEKAAVIASQVSGVQQVVRFYEYID
jgi:osmotically-inducible protein OsmY